MVLDVEKQTKIEEFIETNEETQWLWGLVETVADLAWVEEEVKEWFLNKWLKNDKSLLDYAELTMKAIVEDWKIVNFNFWEKFKYTLLELKLLASCPYFEEFKAFLEDLKRWTDASTTDTSTSTSTTETSNAGIASTWTTSTESASESSETSIHTFCWTSISRIQSEPFEKNSITWVTWCSKTARWNWKNFGLELPSWDAYVAGTNPGKDSIQTIPQAKKNIKPQCDWEWIDIEAFKNIAEWNYADIYTSSLSKKYGHRASAFKDDSWQWYVLDPYTSVNGRKADTSPKKLEDYLKSRNIIKAHIYESKWYKQNNPDVYDDEWEGYEWENHS